MNQYGYRKIRSVSAKALTFMVVIVLFISGNPRLGQASGSDARGLYVSDLADNGNYKHDTLSEGAANIIRRARQMYEIEWTALEDIKSYPGTGQELFFRKGVSYQGIPYGQPVHKGKYVGFDATLSEFAAAAADEGSEMYTTLGENTWYFTEGIGDIKYGPFYSSDCSAFLSYVWGLSGRYTTSLFAEQTLKKSDSGYKNAKFQYMGHKVSDLKVGYALNRGSSHIILIYDIVRDKHDNIVQVTTLEQTPPIMRLRVWGAGGNAGSLSDLQNKIENGPYEIIRYKNMDSVTFEASDAIPLDTENYVNRISEPVSGSASDHIVTGSASVQSGKFSIEGWTYHKNGASAIEYSVDSGSWVKMETAEYGSLLRFSAEADISGSGEHKISVRGTSAGTNYEIADFTVNVGGKAPDYALCFDNLSGVGDLSANNKKVETTIQLNSPKSAGLTFGGWAVSTDGIKGYEYKIDDGLWIPVEPTFRADVYRALKVYQPSCSAYNSFTGGMGFNNFASDSSHTLYIRGITNTNGVFDMAELQIQLGKAAMEIFGVEMNTLTIILASAGAVLVVAAVVIIIVVCRKRKNKLKSNAEAIENPEESDQDHEE